MSSRPPLLAVTLGLGAALLPGIGRAETVALWLFDGPAPVGATRVPGKFGAAYRPAGDTAAAPASEGGAGAAASPTDSRLNLGAGDWTLECWLRLDAGAADEGVLFEIGCGPRGTGELVTRFSVLPRENAFALAGLVSAAAGALRRIEWPSPDGPPAGEAWLDVATLVPAGAALPRGRWFHVALVHAVEAGGLRLYLDGRHCAVAALRLRALPHGAEAYVALGCDGRGRRVLAGAIDELRVSDHAAYAEDFAPPGSFGPGEPAAP